MLLCTITTSVFGNIRLFSIKIDNWDVDSKYEYNIIENVGIKPYVKTIKEAEFIIPIHKTTQIYNLNIYNHRGFSKIYLNDLLVFNVGKPNQINQNTQIYNKSLELPLTKSKNSIKIINYSFLNSIETTFEITNAITSPRNIFLFQIINEIIPITYGIITLLILITLSLYSKKLKLYRHLKLSFLFFTLYFFSRFLDEQIFKGLELDDIHVLFSFLAWYNIGTFYIKKYHLWSFKRQTITLLFMLTILILFTILYQFSSPYIDIEMTKQMIVILVSLVLVRIVIRAEKSDERLLKSGLALSLFLQIIGFIILSITNRPAYAFIQTGFIVIILSFYFNFLNNFKISLKASEIYTNKLLDSMDKLKLDFNKKESIVSDLKSNIEDIEREKSLFFSTLSSNLRTPLNSIIGYSENLYTTENIEDVHHIVNELIVESDKMFQSINNIMDFSSRDFTELDLQLKTFRMKEIFENTVYGSSIITSFRNQINYNAEKDSDKILICGNPLIYKQMTTSVFHFLIGLNPNLIDFTITNTGIDSEFMSLVVKFKGTGLDYSDFSIEESINTNRDVFQKYIKLYAITFSEEITDNSYQIEFNFECGLANSDEIDKNDKRPLNIPLSKNISVLVVEDYKPNLDIVKMHLTKMGCEVFTAANGDEAVTEFNRELIDVVLMDIKMPIMDGWIATEHIRSTKKGLDTLIVGLTASSLDLDIRHCFESGMDDVLVKPIRKNQLYKKLSTIESFKPEEFPSLASLRADYRLSKVESEALFTASITQIKKQLEVIEMLTSAEDDLGLEREIPAIISAAMTINAFYYSRLLRNYFNAYNNRESDRLKELMNRLKNSIEKVIIDNDDIFRN